MKVVRIVGGILAGLLVVLVVIAIVGVTRGSLMLRKTHDVPIPALTAASDSASVRRGEYLAMTRCSGCHSAVGTLPLAGGQAFHMGPIADLYPSNLTPGGAVLAKATDGQLARAIREGVTADGHAMLIMPSEAYHGMSDTDVRQLLGYLRSQSAVTTADTTHRYKFLGTLLVGLGMFPTSVQPTITSAVQDVSPSAGLEYGQYVAHMTGCIQCHGATLHGGNMSKVNIAAIADAHTFEEFDGAVRHGRGVTGKPVAEGMPWKSFAYLNDQDTRAIYEYVKSVK